MRAPNTTASPTRSGRRIHHIPLSSLLPLVPFQAQLDRVHLQLRRLIQWLKPHRQWPWLKEGRDICECVIFLVCVCVCVCV